MKTSGRNIRVLLDSRASDCFISPNYISENHLQTSNLVQPVNLRLFDGVKMAETITKYVSLTLSTANRIPHVSTQFLITPLDPACDAVLGLNWLTEINPRIDLALHSIEWASESNLETAQLRAIVTPESEEDPLLIGEEDDDICPNPLDPVPEHYHDFSDVFDKIAAVCLPPHRSFDHGIELIDRQSPGVGAIYSLSETEQISLKEFLQEHLATNTIHPSKSPVGAPVLFVKKKDGALQMIVDYRRLNRITWKDRYCLPRINDFIDRLGHSSVFTKIDLRNAYHLLQIKRGDEWKTTFRTPYGSFDFLVIPFGLTNAPASFQCFMNTILGNLLDIL